MRYVVTTGSKFTDIDGYACCIAYAEYLRLEGKDAVAVIPGVFNESVIAQVRAFPAVFETTYVPTTDDVFVLQDISDKSFFAPFVVEEKIVAVYDHHFGFEKFWQEKLGTNSHIEKLGACATYVVEEAVSKNLLEKFSESSIKLLYTAIFANSLNLQASVTTERDRNALKMLEPLAKFSPNWQEEYFTTMQTQIAGDPIGAIKNDFKILTIDGQEWAIGQLELWNGENIFTKNQSDFQRILGEHQQSFGFVTIPSIKQGKTFVQPKNEKTREILEQYGLVGNKLSALRLRKEWIKLLMSSDS